MPQALGTGLAAVALLTIAHLVMTSARRRGVTSRSLVADPQVEFE
jgi:hypothetical protein